jgi:3-hydroxyacyl-[acyl-carrier-protein] dehydratase
MHFRLLDRITELEPGVRIRASKLLSGDEQYLKDHFPLFPVMPGVLMLEAMYQASMWLIRRTDDFRYAIVLLKEARNVKYADFITPGLSLEVTSEMLKQEGDTFTLKAQGTINGKVAVSARLVLERAHIKDRKPLRAPSDPYTRKRMKEFYEELYQPAPVAESLV